MTASSFRFSNVAASHATELYRFAHQRTPLELPSTLGAAASDT